MLFAFAIAAIPISYAAADPWLTTHEFGSLLLGVLWMPWIVAAIIVTRTIWTTHSLTLGENYTAINEQLLGVGFTIMFFLVAIGVIYLFGSETNVFIVMGITGDVLTVFIGAVFHYLYRANWILLPLFVAGFLIVLVNIFLHVIGLPSTGAGFVTGFVQGSAYFVAGWIIAARGECMDLPSELSLIHQPIRLRIMGFLYKHRDVSYTRTRNLLDLSDGNLASHIEKLEEE